MATQQIPIPRPRPRPEHDVATQGATQALEAQLSMGEAGASNAAIQTELGTDRAAAVEPATPYVDMSRREKADHLVGLMGDSEQLLEANGVSEHMETKLAAIMTNEGSRNLRRDHIRSSFMGHASTLQQKMGGASIEELQADPDRMARVMANLTEEETHLMSEAATGAVDLAGLRSDDEEVRDAAQNGLTDSGVRLRANQYEEMGQLRERQEGGEALDRDEAARLRTLERYGYRQTGFAGNMGDVGGMSKERFAEIYDEGQQRFEPNQYRSLQESYKRNQGRRDRGSDPTAAFQMSAGIGTFDVDAEMEAELAGDHDLIADMATSYGTAQIMGAYAQQGLLTAQGADGIDDSVSLAELKASGERLTPTTDDVHQQLAFMNMKGVNLGSTTMSDDQLTRTYNGSGRGTDLYRQYMTGLSNGTAAYQSAQRRAGN